MNFFYILILIFFCTSCLKTETQNVVNPSNSDGDQNNPNSDTIKVETLLPISYNKDHIFDISNTKFCEVPVPLGVPKQSQTHPSIVFVKDKWNGYTHWLGTTPYPDADSKYENPCIYHANQIGKLIAPIQFEGISDNPISKKPSSIYAFNSDVELILNKDTLYSIVRENWNQVFNREIKVQSSTDGLSWTKPKHLYSEKDVTGKELLSPAIISSDDKLYIYHLNGDAGNSKAGKCTSLEILVGTSLSKPDFKFLTNGTFQNKEELGIEPWHMDLFEYERSLYMILCGRKSNANTLYTYLAVSHDYKNFYIYQRPLINCFNTYRPSVYIDDGIFTMYFSVVGNYAGDSSDRAIGLAQIKMSQLLNYLSR